MPDSLTASVLFLRTLLRPLHIYIYTQLYIYLIIMMFVLIGEAVSLLYPSLQRVWMRITARIYI